MLIVLSKNNNIMSDDIVLSPDLSIYALQKAEELSSGQVTCDALMGDVENLSESAVEPSSPSDFPKQEELTVGEAKSPAAALQVQNASPEDSSSVISPPQTIEEQVQADPETEKLDDHVAKCELSAQITGLPPAVTEKADVDTSAQKPETGTPLKEEREGKEETEGHQNKKTKGEEIEEEEEIPSVVAEEEAKTPLRGEEPKTKRPRSAAKLTKAAEGDDTESEDGVTTKHKNQKRRKTISSPQVAPHESRYL